MAETTDPTQRIAFQGQPGAYSDLACRHVFPHLTTLPCAAFEDAFAAVSDGAAALAMIPIENSVAGRVADVHHLMPGSGLFIIGEHFERVEHHLLALRQRMDMASHGADPVERRARQRGRDQGTWRPD